MKAKKSGKNATKSSKLVAGKKAVKAAPKAKTKPTGLGAAFKKMLSRTNGAKPAAKAKPVAKSKPTTKPVAKAKPAAKAATPVTAKKPAVFSRVQAQKPSSIIAPKGLMTEAQLRRMSERDYMNDSQLLFFRHKLLEMRQEVLDREVEVKERLHEREVFADPADRATAEEEHWLDLRLRERESLLLRKIDEALRRIDAKEFGYCEKTGDPIGIPRLLARPTATVCVDVKGQDERVEAQFRDR